MELDAREHYWWCADDLLVRVCEQHTNARYVWKEWGIRMQVDKDGRREGERMRKNALRWKGRAKEATVQGVSSYENAKRSRT